MKELSVATHELRKNPNGIRFSYLVKICSHFFGEPRQQRTRSLGLPDALAKRPEGEYPGQKRYGKGLSS